MRTSSLKRFLLLAPAVFALAAQTTDAPAYTATGELTLPKDYREWVFLSSGLGMTYGPAAQADHLMFDNVFVHPRAYKSFLETGRWPEKTMFILEIRGAEEKGSINKGGHYQTGIMAVEAEVKDSARFPQKWAYFGFGRGEKASAFPANSNCNTCHGKDAAVENTFVQFYPTLLEVAKRKGTVNAGFKADSTQ